MKVPFKIDQEVVCLINDKWKLTTINKIVIEKKTGNFVNSDTLNSIYERTEILYYNGKGNRLHNPLTIRQWKKKFKKDILLCIDEINKNGE